MHIAVVAVPRPTVETVAGGPGSRTPNGNLKKRRLFGDRNSAPGIVGRFGRWRWEGTALGVEDLLNVLGFELSLRNSEFSSFVQKLTPPNGNRFDLRSPPVNSARL